MSRRLGATILGVLLLSVTGKAADADKDLRRAAEKCEVAKVHQLLAKRADASGKDEKGVTALMLAAGRGCAEAVEALLNAGADTEAKDSTGSTAAMWAGRHDYADIVKLLDTPRPETAGADTRAGACASAPIKASGKKESQARFFAAPKTRVREVVIDAMSAAGFAVEEEQQQTMHAARKYPELSDEGRSKGEKLVLSLEAAQESGSSGTRVTAETKWGGMWASGSTKPWSDFVLDQAGCLLGLFGLRTDDDILGEERVQADRALQAGPTGSAGSTTLSDGTPVRMRLRRYLSANEQKEKEAGRFAFQVTDDVVLNGTVVVQKGATAWGQVKNAEQSQSFKRSAKLVFSIDYVRAINGQAIPVRDSHEGLGGTSKAKTAGRTAVSLTQSLGILSMAFTKGKNVGIRAGTEFIVFSDGDQSLKLKADRNH